MRDLKADVPFGKPLETAIVVEAEVSRMDHGVGLCPHGQFVDDAKSSVGIDDQQQSYAAIPSPPAIPAGTFRQAPP